jgi:phosphate transport system protein
MTTHYEERMEADLQEIRRKVDKVSKLVEDQVGAAVQAVLDDDRDVANSVILGDRQVNRRVKEIDHLCHAFIVRHAPSAGHLRYASAVLRFAVSLERVGDYAGTIGREVVQISAPPPPDIGRDVRLLGQQARQALSQSLATFHDMDVELGLKTYGLVDQMDLSLRTVLNGLLEAAEQRSMPLRDVFALLRISNLLKRVGEQAANICEQAIFAETGEAREGRVFRILFAGDRNERGSQIAEAYARKAYPESGIYASAGVHPAEALDPVLIDFMDSKGVDVSDARPSMLEPLQDRPRHFHVIVRMAPSVREVIKDIPFRTVVLDWDVDAPPGLDPDTLEQVYEAVVVRVQDLMRTLAGPDAR